MSRWASKYTADQKNAVYQAVLDNGMTAPRVAKAAAAGQLIGLEPFEIPVTTVRALSTKERRRRADKQRARAAQEDPRTAVAAMLVDLMTYARGELDAMARGSRKSASRWEEMRMAARAIGEIERIARAQAGGASALAQAFEDAGEDKAPSLLERLAAERPSAGNQQHTTETQTPALAENTGPEPSDAGQERERQGKRILAQVRQAGPSV